MWRNGLWTGRAGIFKQASLVTMSLYESCRRPQEILRTAQEGISGGYRGKIKISGSLSAHQEEQFGKNGEPGKRNLLFPKFVFPWRLVSSFRMSLFHDSQLFFSRYFLDSIEQLSFFKPDVDIQFLLNQTQHPFFIGMV